MENVTNLELLNAMNTLKKYCENTNCLSCIFKNKHGKCVLDHDVPCSWNMEINDKTAMVLFNLGVKTVMCTANGCIYTLDGRTYNLPPELFAWLKENEELNLADLI